MLILTVPIAVVLVFILKCVYMKYNRVKYYDTLYEGDEQAFDDQGECVRDTSSSQQHDSLSVFEGVHGSVSNDLQNDQSSNEVAAISEHVKCALSNRLNGDLIIFEDVHEDINGNLINDQSAYKNAYGDVNNNFLNSTGSDNNNNICADSTTKTKKRKVLHVYSDNSILTEIHNASVVNCINQSRSLI